MSLRRHVLRIVGALTMLAVCFGALAGTAGAQKLSAKQKAKIRTELRRQIKKNPGLIRSRNFVQKASLVTFQLPVTIRLSEQTDSTTPTSVVPNSTPGRNSANIDLGGSLGTRTIGLGGSLPATITFHDSYDGGGLGNVDLSLPAGGALTTTSIPLLTNTQTSLNSQAAGGCSNFYTGGTAFVDGVGAPFGVTASDNPGDQNLGSGSLGPADTSGPSPVTPTTGDVVLRTGSISLAVAAPGTVVQDTQTQTASQDVVIGKSGGEANLFGKIPGRNTQVDVTASLGGGINSILREVDEVNPLAHSAAFDCRQAWTGAVQNYIPDVKLTGSLRISPAITADGRLRIAKVALASPTGASSRLAVTACLVPHNLLADDSAFAPGANPPTTITGVNPGVAASATKPGPATLCGAPPSNAIQFGLFDTARAAALGTVDGAGGKVTVGADLSVNNITAEVLIGANQ